ncbi:MAG: hypothetical protein CO189_06625 [candidate division Zixibacteria bacterium CG_4_9_14_3_um_filter_46_8]|nr:MAG: hypothetical protein CO189_06625 [candidate division Zixibacteria bacterium CG_4_9_14_3_um_filter_46_8]
MSEINHIMHRIIKILKIAVIIALTAYAINSIYNAVALDKQWDFKTYYYAAKVFQDGKNPYNIEVLNQASGEKIHFKFVYPPYTLYLFRTFLLFDYQKCATLYLRLKLVILFCLIWLWWKKFAPNRDYAIALYLLIVFGFDKAIITDIWAGNLTAFEQFALWIGVWFLLSNKYILFALSMLVSVAVKGPNLGLLILLMPIVDKKTRLWLGGACCIFVALNLISYLNDPGLFRSYLQALQTFDEQGPYNPSSFALIGDVMDSLFGKGYETAKTLLYLIFVASSIFGTLKFIKGYDCHKNKMESLILCFLLYTIIAPIFKNYSYFLLIIPAYYIIIQASKTNLAKMVLLSILCIHIFSYQSLIAAIILLWLHILHLRKNLVDTGLPVRNDLVPTPKAGKPSS